MVDYWTHLANCWTLPTLSVHVHQGLILWTAITFCLYLVLNVEAIAELPNCNQILRWH